MPQKFPGEMKGMLEDPVFEPRFCLIVNMQL